MPIQQMLLGVGAVATKTYVDDVFSMLTKQAPGGTNAVFDVGIDFANRGGMLLAKDRAAARDWRIHDTERGTNSELDLNTSDAADSVSGGNYITSWNNNGFTVSSDWSGLNKDPNFHIWYNFAKHKKFFDIVTYTGNGTARTIAHSLGSVPGMILIKKINGSESWAGYHKSFGNTKTFYPDLNVAADNGNDTWNSTTPTSTHFSLKTDGNTNGNGSTYVAYLFAHNDGDGEFGEGGDQDIIKCGSYSGNSSSPVTVNLGWEPQWVYIKNATDSQNWYMGDSLRGTVTGEQDARLYPNTDDSEVTNEDHIDFTSTGFKAKNNDGSTNDTGHTFVYVAIRRPDGLTAKAPAAGTDVFAMDTGSSSSTIPNFDSGFPVDMAFMRRPASSESWYLSTRLLQGKENVINSTAATTNYNKAVFDHSLGWQKEGNHGSNYLSWMFKRHAGFDVVCYTGTGSNQTVAHSLGVAPQMVWIKNRSNSANGTATAVWLVWHESLTSGSYSNTPNTNNFLELNTTEGVGTGVYFNSTAPTSSVVSLGANGNKWDVRQNQSGDGYLMLLFASVTGICKVGTYTGDGQTEQDISLGFQPRFLMIRKYDGSANWVVFDTVRGWTNSSNEVLLFNSSNAEAELTGTDMYTKPTSTGFKAMGDWADSNNNNSKYIYYAHA